MENASKSDGYITPVANPGDRKSLQEHDKAKTERLQQMRRNLDERRRRERELGSKTRLEQAQRGKVMARGNPLAVNQAELYERNITRLQAKYIFKTPYK